LLLIPVISPGFLRSEACRFEIGTFLEREQRQPGEQVIFPVYFVDTEEFESSALTDDEILKQLQSNHSFLDFRLLRLLKPDDPKYREEVNRAAAGIVGVLREHTATPGSSASSVIAEPGPIAEDDWTRRNKPQAGSVEMVATQHPGPNALLEWAGDTRMTLAIVFTDIVGSTALGNRLGDSKMADVRRAHFAQSDALLEKHGGRQIKTIGDSVMAVFRSTGAALDYARALHSKPGHTELQAHGVRAGIHLGEVEITADDIFGAEVAYASRVAHQIVDAEIWASDQACTTLNRQRALHQENLH
jgi:class 3 adenylate cyclase